MPSWSEVTSSTPGYWNRGHGPKEPKPPASPSHELGPAPTTPSPIRRQAITLHRPARNFSESFQFGHPVAAPAPITR